MKTLLIRTVSGIALAIVVVGALLLSRWTLLALLVALLVGCSWEFFRLTRRSNDTIGRRTGLVLAAALYIALPLALMPFLPVLFDRVFVHTTWMSLCDAFPCWRGWEASGPWMLLGYICIIWANDVFAYLTGITFGKHPLAPKISPKKTWEGFAGGLLGALLVGRLFVYLSGIDFELPYVWGAFVLVIAISGVAGDLFESWLKRRAGVKDSGNILPGHGGWLDRFDALLFSVPFASAFLLLLTL